MTHYCRLCLNSSKLLLSAFVQVDGQCFSSLIQTFCGVQICKNDAFSQAICYDCYKIVEEMFKLREKSLSNNKRLKSSGGIKKLQKDENQGEKAVQDVEMKATRKRARNFHVSSAQQEFEEGFSRNIEDEENLLQEVPTKKFKRTSEAEQKDELFGCTHCDKSYHNKSYVYKHFREKHDPVKNGNKCHLCSNNFRKVIELVKHRKIHEMDALASTTLEIGRKNQVRQCSQCDKKFNYLEDLEEHWDDKHDKTTNSFFCAYCTNRFKTGVSTKKHLLRNHREFTTDGKIIFLLRQNKAIFVNPTELADHSVKQKDGIKRALQKLKESKNSKITKSRKTKLLESNFAGEQIKKNKVRSQRIETIPIDVKFDEVKTEHIPSFDMSSAIQKRLLEDTPKELPVSCSHCDQTFSSNFAIIKHFKEFHNPAKNVNKCHRCEHHFKFKDDFTKHLKIHEMDALSSKKLELGRKNQLRQCSQCAKMFDNLMDLEEHWDEKHEKNLNPYSCNYCNDRFKTQELTKEHLLTAHESLTTDGKVAFLRRLGRHAIFINPTEIAPNCAHTNQAIKQALENIEKLKNPQLMSNEAETKEDEESDEDEPPTEVMVKIEVVEETPDENQENAFFDQIEIQKEEIFDYPEVYVKNEI